MSCQFGATGGQAAALESRDAAQELGAREHGLDDVLALAVERGSVAGAEDRVDALGFEALAWRQRPRFGPFGALGRDDHLKSLVAELSDVRRVPVASVGQDRLGLLVDASLDEREPEFQRITGALRRADQLTDRAAVALEVVA